jgi:hypothetical protein
VFAGNTIYVAPTGCRWRDVLQAQESGYPIEEITRGLWPALEEFLAAHQEWEIAEHYANNNGLTVLRRKEQVGGL